MLLELLVGFVITGLLTAVFILWYTSPVCFPTSGTERSFLDPKTEKRTPFPSLVSDPAEVTLSVVVPSYNEEKRLPPMLDEAIDVLEQKSKQTPSFTYEIIVVDDGSRDKTSQVALNYVKKLGTDKMRVLTFTKNRGKGGAVRWGAMSSRGQYILFADADGATKFADVDRLLTSMNRIEKDGYGVAIGSRAHLQDDAVAKRTLLRNILMYGFHVLVWFVGIYKIRDTQCGFKMFTRKSAAVLFPAMHVERWCFDIELLFLAIKLRFPISEDSVNWQEIDGSKLDPIAATIEMFRDIFLIRLYYLFGLWSVPSVSQKKSK